MTALDVAGKAARTMWSTGAWVFYEPVSGSHNGEVHMWLRNGFGVSLIDLPGDELPELLTMRRGDDSPVTVHGERSTDPTGLMRMCTVDDVVKVLNELRERES